MINAQRLKLLAILFMTIDHLGYAFNVLHRYELAKMADDFSVDYLTDAYWEMRIIGRLAFPIFCFLIAEGCAHTKDIKKYICRLALFAVISQIPYGMFHAIDTFTFRSFTVDNIFQVRQANVLVTLTSGAMAVFFYKLFFTHGKNTVLNKIVSVIGIIVSFYMPIILSGEYSRFGTLIILLVYVFRPKDSSTDDKKIPGSKLIQVLCCTLVIFMFYFPRQPGYTNFEAIGALLSALPLLLYNGQAGNRRFKFAFYIYYPAHMIVLSILMLVVMR